MPCGGLFQRACGPCHSLAGVTSDACQVGREWRYDEDQIRYGYTKDRSILR